MAIHIKNDEVERLARELSARTGESITGAIGASLKLRLSQTPPRRPRPTREEMMRATEKFRRAIGLDQPHDPITKADFDALWEEGLK
ncbi:hypothetical protein BH11PSE2_BH11PSE2_10950 [soil metagenome]